MDKSTPELLRGSLDKAQEKLRVAELLLLHLVKTGKVEKKLGRFLADLKDERERSDYEIYSTIDQVEAVRAVAEAKEFVAAIERYVQPHLLS